MAARECKVEVQEVTLSAKNHLQELNDGLWDLFRASSMVDVTLTCHGKSLKVHRLLLAIFSPILKDAILSASSEEDSVDKLSSIGEGGEKTLLLSLDYVTAEEASYVQYLIEFLYRGTVTLPKEGLESLLQTARVLAVQGLVDAIEEFIDGEMAKAKGRTRNNTEASINCGSGQGSSMVMRKRKPVIVTKVLMDHDNDTSDDEDQKQSQDTFLAMRRSPLRGLGVTSEATPVHQPNAQSESGSTSEQSDTDMLCYSSQRYIEDTEGCDLEHDKDEKLNREEEAATDETVLGLTTTEMYTKKRQRRKPLQPKKVVREPEKDKGETRRIFIKEYCKIWRQSRPVMRCHYCDYETQDKGSYKSHIARHDPSAERFQCNICGKSFRSKNGIRGHMRSHGDPDCLFKCTHCDFQTPQKWNWLKHLAVIHKVDPDGNPLLENIKCDQCQFQCVANHQLKAHVLRHHTLDKPFKCTECDYAAVIKHELNKHISITHKKERSYACDICSFRSQTQGGLTRHRRTHTGEKPFKCDLCEMCYADRGKLKVHILRHAREKKKQYSIIGHSHVALPT